MFVACFVVKIVLIERFSTKMMCPKITITNEQYNITVLNCTHNTVKLFN